MMPRDGHSSALVLWVQKAGLSLSLWILSAAATGIGTFWLVVAAPRSCIWIGWFGGIGAALLAWVILSASVVYPTVWGGVALAIPLLLLGMIGTIGALVSPRSARAPAPAIWTALLVNLVQLILVVVMMKIASPMT